MIKIQETSKDLNDLHCHYGERFIKDTAFCSSIIKDCLTPKYPIEAQLLSDSARLGVAERISKIKKGRKATELVLEVASDLAEKTGHNSEMTIWIVNSWALAFKTISTPISVPDSPCQTNPVSLFNQSLMTPVIPSPVQNILPPISAPVLSSKKPLKCLIRLFLVLVFGGLLIFVTKNILFHLSMKNSVISDTKPTPVNGVLKLTITEDILTLNGKRINFSNLSRVLADAAEKDKHLPVEILYDRNHDPGQLETVKDLCRKAGFKKIWTREINTK
ncbi:MAG: hypothetical protein WBM02_10655 [bacterium]